MVVRFPLYHRAYNMQDKDSIRGSKLQSDGHLRDFESLQLPLLDF